MWVFVCLSHCFSFLCPSDKMAIQWEGCFFSAGISDFRRPSADSNRGSNEGGSWPAGIRGSQIGPGKPGSEIYLADDRTLPGHTSPPSVLHIPKFTSWLRMIPGVLAIQPCVVLRVQPGGLNGSCHSFPCHHPPGHSPLEGRTSEPVLP